MKFADHGFITKDGKLNTNLLGYLGWIWFVGTTIVTIGQHLSHLIKAFLHKDPTLLSIHGNIWDLKMNYENDSE